MITTPAQTMNAANAYSALNALNAAEMAISAHLTLIRPGQTVDQDLRKSVPVSLTVALSLNPAAPDQETLTVPEGTQPAYYEFRGSSAAEVLDLLQATKDLIQAHVINSSEPNANWHYPSTQRKVALSLRARVDMTSAAAQAQDSRSLAALDFETPEKPHGSPDSAR